MLVMARFEDCNGNGECFMFARGCLFFYASEEFMIMGS